MLFLTEFHWGWLTAAGVVQLEAISRRNLHQLQETAEILSDLLATVRRLQGVDEAVASSAKVGGAAK